MKINILYKDLSRINKILFVFIFSFVGFIQTGCKKFVEVPSPATSLTSSNVYTSDATAIAVLTNIYANISGNTPLNAATINSISLISSLSADDLTLFGKSANGNIALVQFYLNSLSPSSTGAGGQVLWNDFYSKLYTVNIALERLAISNSLTPAVKQQLMGEAKFLRAFFYFYLVNLYGDVPLTTTSDYTVNSVLVRSPIEKVYQQIITDLKDAQDLLSDNYIAADATTTTAERVRPNKFVATALLARAYLYTNRWSDAESEATSVINKAALYDTVSLNNAFLKNTKEAIWQLQPVNSGWNTEDARMFILPSTGPTSNTPSTGYPTTLSSQLLVSFESGDQRKVDWINSVTVNGTTYYYPYKYKSANLNTPVTEYTMVFRLGEQYLIRAEARAQLNKTTEGLKDLNVIRHRAGLPDGTAVDQTSLLNLIYHERQVELFTEWGHRWLDMKRTGKLDEVMGNVASQKGMTWSSNWALYPLPMYDITQNPNLKQNPGY